MSFQIACASCGAPTGPSVGLCPYCKKPVASGTKAAADPRLESIDEHYEAGRLEEALTLGEPLLDHDAKAMASASFLVTLAKILLESEGPTSKIVHALTVARLVAPADPQVGEYLDVASARGQLNRERNDPGEKLLRAVIARSPENPHALFLLGSHLFWVEKDAAAAVPLLERAARARPVFLRAWGCLGAVYLALGNAPLAKKAFAKCLELERDPAMRRFFEQQASRL